MDASIMAEWVDELRERVSLTIEWVYTSKELISWYTERTGRLIIK